jgi:hypothetical protein
MLKHSAVVIAVFAGLSAGCASQMLSDDRIRTNTAGILGVAPEDLTISNRNEQVPNTYYTATTKSGQGYACIINGGGILAMGMVNPPMCNKKGDPPKAYTLFAR